MNIWPMFRLIDREDVPGYLAFCEGRMLGAVLYTRLLAYGAGDRNVMFWFARDPEGCAAASLCDGVFTADYDNPEYYGEACAFGSFLGAAEIVTPEYFARNGFAVMRYEGSSSHTEAEDISPERLRELFEVLYENGTESAAAKLKAQSSELFYGSWLTDISHKLRHGLIHGKCIEADGRIVSAALTSGETASSAVLSGVATLRAYRGLGHGRKAVGALSAELSAGGKTVYAAVRPELTDFYNRLGFYLWENGS